MRIDATHKYLVLFYKNLYLFFRAGSETGAGRVRPRRYPVDAHPVLQQPGHLRAGGRPAPGGHRHHGRGLPEPDQGMLETCS